MRMFHSVVLRTNCDLRQYNTVLHCIPQFEMAKEYLKHVLGGNIIDASCGSGIFSRLFAKSEHFAMVYALDYSENMLRQCYEFLKQEANLIDKKFVTYTFLFHYSLNMK